MENKNEATPTTMSSLKGIMPLLEKQGQIIDVDGKNPFVLAPKDNVWIVRSGEINIFSIELEQGRIVSPRNFLASAHEDDVLFGMPQEDMQNGIALFAVGTIGTQLLVCAKDSFLRCAQDAAHGHSIAGAVDTWIDKLSLSIIHPYCVMPKHYLPLDYGSSLHADAATNYKPKTMPVWVKYQEGTAWFVGNKEWYVLSSEVFFPIASSAWFTTENAGIFSTASTQSILQDSSTWSALDEFHATLRSCIARNSKSRIAASAQQLSQRHSADEAALHRALSNMACVLVPSSDEAAGIPTDANALVATMQYVAEIMGISSTGFSYPARMNETSLERMAQQARFRYRKVMLRGNWWQHNHGPLVGIMSEQNIPVALVWNKRAGYTIHNVMEKSVQPVTAENAQQCQPIAISLYRPFPEKILSAKDIIVFGLHGCMYDCIWFLLMGFLGVFIGIFLPVLMSTIFDQVLPEAAHGLLLQLTFILLVAAVALLCFQIIRGVAWIRIQGIMSLNIQTAVWDRLLSLPVSFFRNFSAGDLTKRGLSIIPLKEKIPLVVNATTTFIFSFTYLLVLFYYNARLAWIALSVVCILVPPMFLLMRRIIHYHRSMQALDGKSASMILQYIVGIAKIRVSGVEHRVFQKWSSLFSEKKQNEVKAGVLQNILTTLTTSFPVFVLIILFAWIVKYNIDGFSIGKFAGFITAFTLFQTALIECLLSLINIADIIPLFERMQPILETLPETLQTRSSPDTITGALEVKNVYFQYTNNTPLVLKNVSLHAHPGECIALVGESGGGKSTLFRLLLRFDSPKAGTIYYDGKDIGALDVCELRRQIGVVLQSGKLLSGSIFKNIVGASWFTMDDAWEAARMAGLEEDIKAMPMGMFTFVGEGGGGFSGGQRQRLLIARAIIHKPRILLFDEATSALDNKTQAIITESISRLKTTRIIIAHRITTIMNADRIYVMHNGEIVEVGTYNGLMEKQGFFAGLAKRQVA